MSDLNKKLAVVALILLVTSAFTYWNGVHRGDRFESGQNFLANLNPDEIAHVVLTNTEGSIQLDRNGEGYVVQESNGYRARNDAVNRLVRDLLDIELAKEIGSGEALAEELELEPLGEDSLELALQNQSGEEMVKVRVGKQTDDGSGHFVQRLDGDDSTIYSTADRVSFDTEARDYLKREIVNVTSSDIQRIQGADFVLEREDEGSLELVTPAGKESKSSQVSKLSSFLNRLTFDKVYLADEDEVRDLPFQQALQVDLEDQSGYIVSYAKLDDRHFVKLTGYLSVDSIEVRQDETDDELKEKADVLKRSDEINQFNAYHGSWVYELESFDGDKLELLADDLTE